MYGLSESEFKALIKEVKKNLGDSINPRIFFYGSRVKGNAREFSDIDLLLIADTYDEKSLGQLNFSDLDIPYKVDFVLDKDLYEKYKDEIYAHMVEVTI